VNNRHLSGSRILALCITLVGSALVVLASHMVWVKVSSPIGAEFSIHDIGISMTFSSDGALRSETITSLTVVAIIGLLAQVISLIPGLRLVALTSIGCGALCIIFAIDVVASINHPATSFGEEIRSVLIQSQPGAGAYLMVAAGCATAVGGLVATLTPRWRYARSRPVPTPS
jgi:hypothetical protein